LISARFGRVARLPVTPDAPPSPAPPRSLYDRLGEDLIRAAVGEFYRRAFDDVFIAYFFYGKDHETLAAQQVDFTIALLGGPRRYAGRPISPLHAGLAIRTPHFARRQVLMREVLGEMGVDPASVAEWMELEANLRPLIVGGQPPPCT
jgi:truncated hemoglobin YjbI